MIPALLVSVTLMASPEVSAREMSRYEAARAEAGHDAEAHLKLALWCEQHGLSARKLEHLALALMADPANATARGLMGLMKDGKSWRKPEKVAERIASDAEQAKALAEYNARRAKAEMTADDQWELALWCEDHGLKPEATAHLAAVVRLDPGREAAWKRLGCKKYHGRWMNQEQIDAAVAEEQAQKEADKTWGPKLEKLKEDLKSEEKQADAERELAKIDDPRAVPTVWRLFAQGGASSQTRAVQIFGQTDSVPASRALAMLAIFGQTDAVRRAATESLVWRDQREFLDGLIQSLRKPMKYQVRPVPDGRGTVELFVEGEQYNVARDYGIPRPPNTSRLTSPPGPPRFTSPSMAAHYAQRVLETQRQVTSRLPAAQGMMVANALKQNPGNAVSALAAIEQQVATPAHHYYPKVSSAYPVTMDAIISSGHALPPPVGFSYNNVGHMWIATSGEMTPGVFMGEVTAARRYQQRLALAEYQWEEFRHSVVAREAQVERDVAALNATNRVIEETNTRAQTVLEAVTGQSFGADREQWSEWLADVTGYAYQTSNQPKPTFRQAAPLAYVPTSYNSMYHAACFAKGTLVHTLKGPKPIETVQIGDRVLTQDVKTGELSYQPVLAPVHNPPSETFRVGLGSETIEATGIHRFWKVGEGWAMVRDLKPGDRVRTVGGTAEVQSGSAGPTQPVFNLEVASDRNYFVGKTGFLVHDNSLVETVDQPFDQAPTLAAK